MGDKTQAVRACMRMLASEYSSPLALVALGYACAKYEGVFREGSGEPYVEHPARVACSLNGFPSTVIIAALLHDVPEDTGTSFEELARLFPAEVVEIVRVLTNTEYPSKGEAIRAALRHKWASVVKVADRLDNIRSLAAASAEKRLRYAKVTLESFVPEAEKCAERFPDFAVYFQHSVGQIREMCREYLNAA